MNPENMNSRELMLAALRSDPSLFIRRAFHTVSPGDEYKHNWHVDAIAYYLMLAMLGDIKRLIITMPPRFMKSISASVAFVAWLLGRDPTARVICASYALELAMRLSMDTRRVMDADWYQE